MSKIYMYPKNDYRTLESPNPYILNLEKSLSKKHTIINQFPNNKGVFDLFLYLFRADIFFFNWIEDVSLKKFGKIQAILFPVFLFFAKIIDKKIVWVLHNKYSHEKRNRQWTRYGFELMIRNSDLIITHSNEGIEFVRERFPLHVNKIKYFIHPVEGMFPLNPDADKIYDLLIWGTIHPYKGVIDFMNFVRQSPEFKNIRIMISGKCSDPQEKEQLEAALSENILHIDKFQSIEEIAQLANHSRFVLFTYNSESILSSGSLMDSIRMGSSVIGPDKGAFRDIKPQGFISTYKSFNEIGSIIKKLKTENMDNSAKIKNFCSENTWDLFGERLFKVSGDIF